MNINKGLAVIVFTTMWATVGLYANILPVSAFRMDRTAHQKTKATISIEVSYLGNAVKGATVSIIEDGNTLTSATTNRRGKTDLSVSNYALSPVTLYIKKEGYQTHLLIGLILKNGSDYEFSLVKGNGTITTEVSTDMQNIKSKGEKKVERYEGKAADAKEESLACFIHEFNFIQLLGIEL
jgi:hypothetical protein